MRNAHGLTRKERSRRYRMSVLYVYKKHGTYGYRIQLSSLACGRARVDAIPVCASGRRAGRRDGKARTRCVDTELPARPVSSSLPGYPAALSSVPLDPTSHRRLATRFRCSRSTSTSIASTVPVSMCTCACCSDRMLARVRVLVLVLGGLLGFTERGLRSGGSWAGGARAGKGRGASGVCGVGDGGAGYGLRAAGRERGGCMWRAGEGTYERCPSVRAPRRVGRRASRRGRAGGPRCTGAAQRSAQASGLRT